MTPRPNRIRNLRKHQGLTQVELAKALMVTEFTIIRWEKGTTNLSEDTLDKLARFFQVAPTDIVPALTIVPVMAATSEVDRMKTAFSKARKALKLLLPTLEEPPPCP